ncbi:PREDICTED: uncharacterized protein LOC108557817 [Nicrophorus vespilloides]|uniref:Uncharacterized protein LOC108557817 n=1 Tax=Nicrophorus vespilloides TaxID=110193 RepID=A0ABM1M5Y1_NICVS|nr:PREDICTED: uncharacterized protein LOC108557817 [Nicrophorus vespilloides]
MIRQLVFVGLIAFVACYPYNDGNPEELDAFERQDEQVFRQRRFVSQVNRPRPGPVWSPPIPRPQGPQTSVNPSIRTDKAGTTNVGVDINHKRPGAEINAHIDQNVRGPGKSSKPNWHVEATID